MKHIGLLFPHQLFEQNELIDNCETIYLIEEFLFFKQYNFHQQKILFHRATMKFYESYLISKNIKVIYIDAQNELSNISILIEHLYKNKVNTIHFIEVIDNWLDRKIKTSAEKFNISLHQIQSPMFLNSKEDLLEYFKDKKRMFQTDFYKNQRQRKNILLDEDKKPIGGKWTFDDENRLKYPNGKVPPKINKLPENSFFIEAKNYTQANFFNNYGHLNDKIIYPTTFQESKTWLQDFLQHRFYDFGIYEDSIVSQEIFLHHSILTPMLNVGLLTPDYVIDETIKYAFYHDIPINSLEGFIRQILGWREFIRAVYEIKGTEERTKNYWNFKRKIPRSFWDGTTGIAPIDQTIQKILKTGYCHHIERLMVIGNFMLLCEFDPKEVYQWFMELFIDAYDWVMVPNVYGMSQFADGGLMSTKPYISGSNYLMKMSNFTKGDWQQTWDGLFWRFMHQHRNFFLQNPRLGMLINMFDKMPEEKQTNHIENAEKYLISLN
jgi:deoxyribodipyrimidine photolyase-related protein